MIPGEGLSSTGVHDEDTVHVNEGIIEGRRSAWLDGEGASRGRTIGDRTARIIGWSQGRSRGEDVLVLSVHKTRSNVGEGRVIGSDHAGLVVRGNGNAWLLNDQRSGNDTRLGDVGIPD